MLAQLRSTGLFGRSTVREVRLFDNGSAKVVRKTRLPSQDFGEGLVHRRGDLLQLLWQKGEGIRYKAQAGTEGVLEPAERFQTPLADGWGFESIEDSLVVTGQISYSSILRVSSCRRESPLVMRGTWLRCSTNLSSLMVNFGRTFDAKFTEPNALLASTSKQDL